jgi:hypothetical protein
MESFISITQNLTKGKAEKLNLNLSFELNILMGKNYDSMYLSQNLNTEMFTEKSI